MEMVCNKTKRKYDPSFEAIILCNGKKKREHDGNIQFIFETSINRPVSVQFKVHNKDINSKPFKF